jgi:simple sugar transport system ATP-binding protein
LIVAHGATPLLSLQQVSKSFGSLKSLQEVNLDIGRGEVIGLLGDNGAGKSTLIKILAGVHTPTSGRIMWEGKPFTAASPRDAMARGISVVYQDLAIIPLLSIYRNFFLGREEAVSRKLLGVYFIRRREARRIAAQALGELGIHIKNVDATVARLSGGERQSISIARAVHFESQLLILDEPTAALSLKETAKVLAYVRQARSKGVSVILITHNIQHARDVCDRFVVLYHGRIAEVAARDAVSREELAELINTGRRGSGRVAN